MSNRLQRLSADWSTTRRQAVGTLRKELSSHHRQIVLMANRADLHDRERSRRVQEIRDQARDAVRRTREHLAAEHERLMRELRWAPTPSTETLQRRATLAQLASASMEGLTARSAVDVVAAAARRSREEGAAFAERALARFGDSAPAEDLAALRTLARETMTTSERVTQAMERTLVSWDARAPLGLGFDAHAEELLGRLGSTPTGWRPGDDPEPALAEYDNSLRRLSLWDEGAAKAEAASFDAAFAELSGQPAPTDSSTSSPAESAA